MHKKACISAELTFKIQALFIIKIINNQSNQLGAKKKYLL